MRKSQMVQLSNHLRRAIREMSHLCDVLDALAAEKRPPPKRPQKTLYMRAYRIKKREAITPQK
jgi:hypothetical protein